MSTPSGKQDVQQHIVEGRQKTCQSPGSQWAYSIRDTQGCSIELMELICLDSLIHVIDFHPSHLENGSMITGRVTATKSFHNSCLPQNLALEHSERTCRWIHIPVNDVDVAQVRYDLFVSPVIPSFTNTSLEMCQKVGRRSYVPPPARYMDTEASACNI